MFIIKKTKIYLNIVRVTPSFSNAIFGLKIANLMFFKSWMEKNALIQTSALKILSQLLHHIKKLIFWHWVSWDKIELANQPGSKCLIFEAILVVGFEYTVRKRTRMANHCSVQAVFSHHTAFSPGVFGFSPLSPSVLEPNLGNQKQIAGIKRDKTSWQLLNIHNFKI